MSYVPSPLLPNRKRLRAGFFTAFFAGWGVLMLAGAGCQCDELMYWGGGLGDPSVSFISSESHITHMNDVDNRDGIWVKRNQTTFVGSLDFGIPLWMPEVFMFMAVFISDLNNLDDDTTLPNDLTFGMRKVHEEEAQEFNSLLKYRGNGLYFQDAVTSMPETHFEPDDICELYVRSRGRGLANSFAFAFDSQARIESFRALRTTLSNLGPMATWRLWRATSRMRAAGESPMLLPLAGTIPEGTQRLVTLNFGLPLQVSKGELTVDGTFAGASSSRIADLPKKLTFIGTLLDQEGKKVDKFKIRLRVRGNTFRSGQKKFDLGPWDIEPGYSLRVDLKLQGGSIEASDAPVMQYNFDNDDTGRETEADAAFNSVARQRAAEALRLSIQSADR